LLKENPDNIKKMNYLPLNIKQSEIHLLKEEIELLKLNTEKNSEKINFK
jgi:hypothetical protein